MAVVQDTGIPLTLLLCLFQYGDDYDDDSDQPVSILKEHTMFTDTHV